MSDPTHPTATVVSTHITVREAAATPRCEIRSGQPFVWFTPDAFLGLAGLPRGEQVAWLRDTADLFAELAVDLEDGAVSA